MITRTACCKSTKPLKTCFFKFKCTALKQANTNHPHFSNVCSVRWPVWAEVLEVEPGGPLASWGWSAAGLAPGRLPAGDFTTPAGKENIPMVFYCDQIIKYCNNATTGCRLPSYKMKLPGCVSSMHPYTYAHNSNECVCMHNTPCRIKFDVL